MKKISHSLRRVSRWAAAVVVGMAFASSAQAACSNPSGNEGEIRYAGIYHTMVFCDGNNWISMAGGVSVTVAGTTGATSLASLTDVNTSGLTSGKYLAYNGTSWVPSSTVGGLPAGNTTEIQFNSSGAFGSSSNLIWSGSGLGVTGTIIASGQGTFGNGLFNGGVTVTGQVSASTVSSTLIQVGPSTATCVSSISGSIRWGSASNTLQICAGSGGWVSLASGTAGTATVGGSTTQIQFNDNGVLNGTNNLTFISSTGVVSTTAVSVTTVAFGGSNLFTSLAGGGGNFIASSTTSVSTSSAGTIKFATSGSQRMVIDSSGNVGIGTTNPSYQLDVRGAGTIGVSGSVAGYYLYDRSVGVNASALYRTGAKTYLWDDVGGNRFTIDNSTGNVGIGTAGPTQALDVYGTNTAAMVVRGPADAWSATYLGLFKTVGDLPGYAGSVYPVIKTDGSNIGFVVNGAWGGYVNTSGFVNVSSRLKKENYEDIDYQALLSKLQQLPVMKWNYKSDNNKTIKHIGPFAEDFHAAFGLNGSDDTAISDSDRGGVALAAIKGLIERTNALKADNDNQAAEIKALKAEVEALKAVAKH